MNRIRMDDKKDYRIKTLKISDAKNVTGEMIAGMFRPD